MNEISDCLTNSLNIYKNWKILWISNLNYETFNVKKYLQRDWKKRKLSMENHKNFEK